MNSIDNWRLRRRDVIKVAAAWTGTCLAPAGASTANGCRATPSADEGLLYPAENIAWTNDLTRIPDGTGVARGQAIYLQGQITCPKFKPVNDAVVEIWQADSKGYYKHPRHWSPAILDPNFRYFGKVRCDQHGRYSIKTISPGGYSSFGIERAAHVHIKVRSRNHGILTSEIYFSGAEQDKRRAYDPVFQSRRHKELLIAKRSGRFPDPRIPLEFCGSATVCNFDVVYSL